MIPSFPGFPRIVRTKGSPFDAGRETGQQLGPTLSAYIDLYLSTGPFLHKNFDFLHHSQNAMNFLTRLPDRFRLELEGLAYGAQISLERVAEWVSAESCLSPKCSGFILKSGGKIWIGRNNDLWSTKLWGYALNREIFTRIPTLTFGLAGDVFTATGLNRAGLWLHYNYLKAPDLNKETPYFTPNYIQIPDMLETCESMNDVSRYLMEKPRSEGMMLFVSDFGNNEHGIFECTCRETVFRTLPADLDFAYMAGTNHYTASLYDNSLEPDRADSLKRYKKLEKCMESFRDSGKAPCFQSLRAILADDQIEKRDHEYGTVYANLYCPATHKLWYTFGGYPAASCGRWKAVMEHGVPTE